MPSDNDYDDPSDDFDLDEALAEPAAPNPRTFDLHCVCCGDRLRSNRTRRLVRIADRTDAEVCSSCLDTCASCNICLRRHTPRIYGLHIGQPANETRCLHCCGRVHCGICGIETAASTEHRAQVTHGGPIDSIVCADCAANQLSVCSNCNFQTTRRMAQQRGGVCPHCDCLNANINAAQILGHAYRPETFRFQSARGEHTSALPAASHLFPEVHLGPELEIESGGACDSQAIARAVAEELGPNWYSKRDGSLMNGVEVVAHPHALSTFPFDKLRKFCDRVKAEGGRSYTPGNCGLHVHISRTGLPENCPRNSGTEEAIFGGLYILRDYLRKLSHRKDNGWCGRYCAFPTNNYVCRCSNCTTQYRGNRYTAINFSRRDTIEVRFFRGTLHAESCVNSIKFAYEMVRFFASVSCSRYDLFLKGQLAPEILWFDLLKDLPMQLRQWAVERSESKSAYTSVKKLKRGRERIGFDKDTNEPIYTEGMESGCA